MQAEEENAFAAFFAKELERTSIDAALSLLPCAFACQPTHGPHCPAYYADVLARIIDRNTQLRRDFVAVCKQRNDAQEELARARQCNKSQAEMIAARDRNLAAVCKQRNEAQHLAKTRLQLLLGMINGWLHDMNNDA